MGMTSKYSQPIYIMAEHVDAIESDCTCNECMDCCLLGMLEKFAEDVDSLECLYDAELKKIELLKANNSDRKKLIEEILTAIQDGEVITGDRIEDWGQEEYGIEHRTGVKG